MIGNLGNSSNEIAREVVGITKGVSDAEAQNPNNATNDAQSGIAGVDDGTSSGLSTISSPSNQIVQVAKSGSVVTGLTIAQIKKLNKMQLAYDDSVKNNNGQLECRKDGEVLQWDEGTDKWGCVKPVKAVFGKVDSSVVVKSNGSMQCRDHGEVIYWDDNDDQWSCGEIGDGITVKLGALSDVNLTTPTNGELLLFDGTNWKNGGVATALGGLGVIAPGAGASVGTVNGALTCAGNGEILQYNNSTKKFDCVPASSLATAEADTLQSVTDRGATSTNSITVAGLTTAGTAQIGTLSVTDNTILGDASTDTLTLNSEALAIPNNLNIDSGTLFVDSTNNRVGIGTTAPDVDFEVSGSGRFKGLSVVSTNGVASASVIAKTYAVMEFVSTNGDNRLKFLSDNYGGGGYIQSGNYDNTGNKPLTFSGYYGSMGSEVKFKFANSSFGSGGAALSTADVFGNMAIGSYAGNNVAPNNGLIVSGNVGIGTTNPTEKLTVYNGSTTGTYTTTGWVHSSDRRLKTNIEPIEGALALIDRLEGVTFNWNSDASDNQQVGFIAQDVAKVLPQVVVGNEKDGYGISYGNITALLTQAIKEQSAQIDANKLTIASLLPEDIAPEELRAQIAQMREQNEAITTFINAINPETLLYTDVDGNLELEGILVAKEVRADKLSVKKIEIDSVETIGVAIISKGDKKVKVKSEAVKKGDKVFVTVRKTPVAVAVDDVKDGEFEIVIAQKQDKEVVIDWWIVGAVNTAQESDGDGNEASKADDVEQIIDTVDNVDADEGDSSAGSNNVDSGVGVNESSDLVEIEITDTQNLDIDADGVNDETDIANDEVVVADNIEQVSDTVNEDVATDDSIASDGIGVSDIQIVDDNNLDDLSAN